MQASVLLKRYDLLHTIYSKNNKPHKNEISHHAKTTKYFPALG